MIVLAHLTLSLACSFERVTHRTVPMYFCGMSLADAASLAGLVSAADPGHKHGQ